MADGPGGVNSIVPARAPMQHRNMKPNLSFCCAGLLLLLAGCTPLSIYHQEGVAVTRMQSDLLACEVAAVNNVPVSTQLRREPPIFVPGQRVCRRDGRCYFRDGYYVEGRLYTVDANRGLRGRVQAQCMADKGYDPVSLPQCSSGVARQVPPGATQILPPLTDKSCVVKNNDGTWQIVTVR